MTRRYGLSLAGHGRARRHVGTSARRHGTRCLDDLTHQPDAIAGVSAVLPDMIARRPGHILNLGSVAGIRVGHASGVYSATKFSIAQGLNKGAVHPDRRGHRQRHRPPPTRQDW
ncbi:SDR family NAD(P)-dependent oxidoreductase [Streptomyces sp. NPDC002144]|uniref:SDR family NAD(P)-dependent oxidoreductase n=1 Tax=Streptomyces sp. NPDC006668 TaxID=3156903 RepID=UPI0034111A4E